MKILIVKTSAIGDVIQTFPVLSYLKRKFPEAKIDWVVEKGIADLVMAHPAINQAIIVDTKKWRKALFHSKTWQSIKEACKQLKQTEYDLLFDLQGNSKSALFTLMAKSKKKIGFGFKTAAEVLNCFTTSIRFNVPLEGNIQIQYLRLVQSYFQDFSPFSLDPVRLKGSQRTFDHPTLMVCFGSRWPNKQLGLPTLVQLLKMVELKFPLSFLFIFSSEQEKKEAEYLQGQFPQNSQILGHLTLPELQNVMHEVTAVLSMDSATLHLCGTTSTPSFSLFGPSSALVYNPIGEQHMALQGCCPYGKTFVKRCPLLRSCKTGACIKDLTAQAIFIEFERFLEKALQDLSCLDKHLLV